MLTKYIYQKSEQSLMKEKKLTFGLKAHLKYKILNVTPELFAKA